MIRKHNLKYFCLTATSPMVKPKIPSYQKRSILVNKIHFPPINPESGDTSGLLWRAETLCCGDVLSVEHGRIWEDLRVWGHKHGRGKSFITFIKLEIDGGNAINFFLHVCWVCVWSRCSQLCEFSIVLLLICILPIVKDKRVCSDRFRWREYRKSCLWTSDKMQNVGTIPTL